MTESYDVKQDLRHLYHATTRFQLVDVPPMRFLTVDGAGDPNTSASYRDALQGLYPTAYAVRAVAIETLGRKHTVGPLEGLWWAEDLTVFEARDPDAWQWRLMIVQPDWVTSEMFEVARERAARKVPQPVLDPVRFDEFDEGRAVQVLHVGPYDAEGPTIARMHQEFVPSHGLTLRGLHHEIYLSDARRVEPARRRTILRQPVSG